MFKFSIRELREARRVLASEPPNLEREAKTFQSGIRDEWHWRLRRKDLGGLTGRTLGARFGH